MTTEADGDGYLSGEDEHGVRGGADAATDRDGGGVLIGVGGGDATFVLCILLRNRFVDGVAERSHISTLSKILVLLSQNKLYLTVLAILFVVFLVSR